MCNWQPAAIYISSISSTQGRGQFPGECFDLLQCLLLGVSSLPVMLKAKRIPCTKVVLWLNYSLLSETSHYKHLLKVQQKLQICSWWPWAIRHKRWAKLLVKEWLLMKSKCSRQNTTEQQDFSNGLRIRVLYTVDPWLTTHFKGGTFPLPSD